MELFVYLVKMGQLTNNRQLETIVEEFRQAFDSSEKLRSTRILGGEYMETILRDMGRMANAPYVEFGGRWVSECAKRLQFVFE